MKALLINNTIEAYSSIVKNHIKPNICFYKISQITRSTLQEFINNIYIKKSFSKNFLNNIKKVVKGSFTYAYGNDLLKTNPSIGLKLPKYDVPPNDPAHIFTNEEINLILDRFKNNHCVYYAFLTAYCTGLRVAEVFALTWNDIDFRNKTISVNKNILKKNQKGGTKNRHISGNSTTVWYFGTCKTETSYRTIPIGDTLLNALKSYKKEQEENKINYGDTYMKHYKKSVINPYNNKTETKIINAYKISEIFDWKESDCIKFKRYIQLEILNIIEPRKDVIKNFNRIKKINHKIYIITGRKFTEMNDTYNETLDWLKINDIPFDELIIEEKNKGKACLEKNIDVYMDDSVKHLRIVHDMGIKNVYLFDNVYNMENKESG